MTHGDSLARLWAGWCRPSREPRTARLRAPRRNGILPFWKGLSLATVRLSHAIAAAIFAFILGGWTSFLSGACDDLHAPGKFVGFAAVGALIGFGVSVTACVRDALRPRPA